jgi:hypothetical protein
MKDYYNYMVEKSGKAYDIKCPNQACGYKASDNDIKELLGEASYKKFRKFLMQYEVARSKNKKFCPQPDCESIIDAKPSTTQVKCPTC